MKFNAIIIGFGKGGKTLAGYLAKKGFSVCLVEKSKMMYGGTCINVGCIPSKTLINSSTSVAEKGNLDIKNKKHLYLKAVENKRRVTALLRAANYNKLASLEKVTILDGTASFIDDNKVKVILENGKEVILEGEKIFINVGSKSIIPNIKGINESNKVYYSDSLMDLDVLPLNLSIIGGGYIGLEFASMYADFGSKVTIIQDGPVFLPREDKDIAQEIYDNFTSRGINIIMGAKIKEITKGGTIKYNFSDNETIDILKSNAILVATGRTANTTDLHLENAHVNVDRHNSIVVDEHLLTSNKNIYALGDCKGGLQFTYISLDDYRIVKDHLENNQKSTKLLPNRSNVPYSVFINPSLSRVGLSEKEVIEKGYTYKIAKLKANAIPKTMVLNNRNGLLKVIIDAKTDFILGASLYCLESYEMINILKMAIDLNVKYTYLRDNIYTHPTMSEAFNDLFSNIVS